MSFDSLWSALEPIGRDPATGGYRRFAWTETDAVLREWFTGEAVARGLDLTLDRAGNQWAWWGDPDTGVRAGRPGIVIGSHLDSVPDGGAFDGPLGVVSAFAALDVLRAKGFRPGRPVAVVNFADEEGARFGVACAGSRIITGALSGDGLAGLTDAGGTSMAGAMTAAGQDPRGLGRDEETLRRIATFVELHIEQGLGLVDLDRPVAVGSSIFPHGRWRFDLKGQANHAGTTRLEDRDDAMLAFASVVLAIRRSAERHGVLATCGKVAVRPNGVNAIVSHATGWLDARGADPGEVSLCVDEIRRLVVDQRGEFRRQSWTGETMFDPLLAARLSTLLGGAPQLPTGAGHDAGILANAGIPAAMLFVRNPTGVSHSPAEFAAREDCLTGVDALVRTIEALADDAEEVAR